jgi:hypothetical protein
MKELHRIFVFVFLLAQFAFPLLAQDEDPEQRQERAFSRQDTIVPPSAVVPLFTLDMLEQPFEARQLFVDTTLTGFQRYRFVERASPFYAYKGNIGHVVRLMGFHPDTDQRFSLDGPSLYPGSLLRAEQMVLYRPEYVFTDLYYALGSGREQSFYAQHTQRLHDNVYAGVLYQVVSSPGIYDRMGARNGSVRFNMDFLTPDERYQVVGSYISNRFENQESGGLKNHLNFEEDEARDSVFLYRAMSRYRETAINIHQFYQTGFFTSPQGDSHSEPRFINLGRIHHHFQYRRQAYVFDEAAPPAPLYFPPPANPRATLDSTIIHRIENQLSWSNFPLQSGRGAFPFNFKLSIQHAFTDIKQPDFFVPPVDDPDAEAPDDYLHIRENYHQFTQEVELETDRNRFFSGRAGARFTFGGYNDDDLELNATLHVGRENQTHRLEIGAGYSMVEAPYFLQRFSGNYIAWNNDFDKMRTARASAIYKNPLFSLDGGFFLLSNMVFMNKHAFPEQNTNTFSLITAGMTADLNIGAFRTYHNIRYQHTASRQFESFPSLISLHSFYFDFAMFQKALLVHAGLDLKYNSPYQPMAYMPVVRQFYAQDHFDTGHDVLLDAFVNFKISRVRLFLKFEHILGWLTDAGPVYMIPFYPLPERTIKFGISWMFFD